MIDGEVVLHELVLEAGPDEVFEMFVDPALLVRWIGISADLDPRPGGRFRFEVMPGEFCEGEYVEVDRPNRVVVTWGWTNPVMGLPPGSSVVEVAFSDAGDGRTRLRLVHRDLPRDQRGMTDDGWSRFLGRLVDVAAGREPAPYPTGAPGGESPA